jgi:hypothetical protein
MAPSAGLSNGVGQRGQTVHADVAAQVMGGVARCPNGERRVSVAKSPDSTSIKTH